MRMVESRSMPFWIPFEITAAVIAAVMRKKTIGSIPPVKSENATVSPVSEKRAYAAVHPAITR